MLEGIPLNALGIGSGWALVALFVILIYRGKLMPRQTYDDKAHEADEWRTESRIKDQQIHELTEQNTAMLRAFGPTLTDFLRGLRQAANGGRRAASDVVTDEDDDEVSDK